MSIQPAAPRRIGNSALVTAPIGLGCMSLSGVYNKISDEEGESLIHAALDNGITLLDTSDAYGAGHNEELVGRAIKNRRKDVIVATKFGNLGGKGGKFADGRPEYVIASCEASLKRLGVEVIDLYYQHRVDPEVPIEDTVGAMATLVRQGKVQGPWIERGPSRDNTPCSRNASDRGHSERILAALPRARRRDAETHPSTWYLICGLFTLGAWPFHRLT